MLINQDPTPNQEDQGFSGGVSLLSWQFPCSRAPFARVWIESKVIYGNLGQPLAPCEVSLGSNGAQYASVSMRRHHIGLAVEKLYTGRGQLTYCSPFHFLLASGEGWIWEATRIRTLSPSHGITVNSALLTVWVCKFHDSKINYH